MNLAENIHELLIQLDNQVNELNKTYDAIRNVVEERSGGKLTVCNGRYDGTVQLWYNSDVTPTAEVYEIVKNAADDQELHTSYEDEEASHIQFKIDKHPFVIVLSKED